MKTDKRVVIYPVDGQPQVDCVISDLEALFANPLTNQLVGMVKLNDGLHFPQFGPYLLRVLEEVVPRDIGWMIDLKIADVKTTNANTLKHYAPYQPKIVTVSSCVSSQALMAVKEALPETTIALVCALTDIPEKEFLFRYKMTPLEKILKDLNDFDQILGADNPVGAIVSSPKCSRGIKDEFGSRFLNVTPGIRSPHMAKDHQEQILSAYEALCNGSDLLVIGTQIAVGNPSKGISPQMSQEITLQEIERYFSELDA